jgi:hypothetical protein
MRDLDWIIDQIQYDFEEDNDDVNGSWRIVRKDTYVFVLYEPYDDGSAEFVYEPKATVYEVRPIEVVEGQNAKRTFETWTGWTKLA